MSEEPDDLERAARRCDGNAELYAAYARQERRSQTDRKAFLRDAQTCWDLGRQIRSLRGEPRCPLS